MPKEVTARPIDSLPTSLKKSDVRESWQQEIQAGMYGGRDKFQTNPIGTPPMKK
jgi:hypothetical protein